MMIAQSESYKYVRLQIDTGYIYRTVAAVRRATGERTPGGNYSQVAAVSIKALGTSPGDDISD